jgi:hypothetical protein
VLAADSAGGEERQYQLRAVVVTARHRWAAVAVGVGVAVLAVGVGSIAVFSSSRHHPRSIPPAPPSLPVSPATAAVGPGLVWRTPVTVVPSGTPTQEQYDQAFEQTVAGQHGLSVAEHLVVPAPAITGGWPRLAVATTAEAWARAFVAGLLDVDYAHQSRPAMGSWLQAQEAPMLIPGLPATVADKVLYLSLLDPQVLAGQPSPISAPVQWQADAHAGVRQSVSDLLVQPDAAWTALTASGWQPADARMAGEDVSGLLTVRRGQAVTVHHFTLEVFVGSARWHDGYGTESITGWQEQG